MSYKLVRVSWLDTVEHPTGWYQPEDIDKLDQEIKQGLVEIEREYNNNREQI